MYIYLSLILFGLFILVYKINEYLKYKEIIENYPNGKVKLKEEYYQTKGEKILHGNSTKYYENGNLKEGFQYKMGVKHGIQKFYDENGNLQKQEVYKSGVKIG